MQLATSSVSAWPCQCLSTPTTSYAAAAPSWHAHTPRTRQLHTPYHQRHLSLTLTHHAAKQTPAAAGSKTPSSASSPASSPAPLPPAASRGPPSNIPTPTSTPKPEGLLHLYSLTPALGPPTDLGPGAGGGGASPLAHVVLPDPSYVVGPRQYRRGLERAWHKMPLPRDLDQVCGEVWGKVWGHHGQRHRSTQHIALSRSFQLLLTALASVLVTAPFFGSIVAPCFQSNAMSLAARCCSTSPLPKTVCCVWCAMCRLQLEF